MLGIIIVQELESIFKRSIMELKPEQLLAKIGILVMENDILRVELGKLQQEKTKKEEEKGITDEEVTK